MKFIKNFEGKIDIGTPEVYDYVICKEDILPDSNFSNFLKNSIGHIISKDKYGGLYRVEFSYVPEILSSRFNNDSRGFYKYEFEHWSKNEEDLKIYLDIKKYNL